MNKQLSELVVGDEIVANSLSSISIRKVICINKTSITDDRNSKWTLRGRPWGDNDKWSAISIYALTEENRKSVLERIEKSTQDRRRTVVKSFDWHRPDHAPQSLIDAVYALIELENSKRPRGEG